MEYFDVRQPRPIRDIGDSRDEINSKRMEDDLMPAVRPTIPSQLLKISIRDLISSTRLRTLDHVTTYYPYGNISLHS